MLILWLPRATVFAAGGLPPRRLARGWYGYVGSARGRGGLRGRLAHHLRAPARPRWHIDALRRYARVAEIWWSVTAAPRERDWVDLLSAWPGSSLPYRGFGASDSDRVSHLIGFAARPHASRLGEQTAASWAQDGRLRRQRVPR